MNLEAFLLFAGPINLIETAPDTPLKIKHQDRKAIDFAVKKEIIEGRWEGSTFHFKFLTPKGHQLLTRLFADVSLRRATEQEFATATRFHLKSALRFLDGAAALNKAP